MVENRQTMDNYLVTLSNIVSGAEEAYGLNEKGSDGVYYCDMDINELIGIHNNRIGTLDPAVITDINIKAGRSLVLLSYTKDRLDYYGKKRLDFSKYPGMVQVAKVLLAFTKAKTVDESSLKGINMIIELLLEIDTRYLNFRGGLGYRYLRIFTLLVMYGNYFNAAIVARFILFQLIVKEKE